MIKNIFTALLAAWAITGSTTAQADEMDEPKVMPPFETYDSKGFHYLYENIRIPNLDGINGTITVTSPKGNEVVTKLSGLPPSKCDETMFKNGTIIKTKLKQEFVLICGGDEGHRETLFIFESGNFVTSLEFFESKINITQLENSDNYVSEVYNRMFSENGGLDYFLTVYKWSPTDIEIDKFHPIRNRFSEKYYLSYYFSMKELHKNRSEINTPALASLISIPTKSNVCNEINGFFLRKFKKQDLEKTLLFIEKNNDISFDLSSCQKRR